MITDVNIQRMRHIINESAKWRGIIEIPKKVNFMDQKLKLIFKMKGLNFKKLKNREIKNAFKHM